MSEKKFSDMQNKPDKKHAKHLKITKRDKHLTVKILVAFAVIVSGLSGASLYLNKRSQKREVAYLDRFNLASDRDVQASDGNALNQFASEVAAASSEDSTKGHTVVVNGKVLDDDSTVDSLASSADSSIKYDGLYVMNYADAQQAESAVSNLNTDNSKPASVVDGAVWSIQNDAKQNYDKPTEIPDSLVQSASPREDAAKQKKALVALIDTGDNNADSSVDFTGTGSQDRNGHGTYMAGLIKEKSGDQAYILSLKAMNDDGTGSMENVTAAVKYAINAGADIINMSISAPDSDAAEAFKTVVQQAVDNGIRVVAAAGNYSADISKYVPANIPGVISVGAVTEDGMIADFSNYGKSLTMSVKSADSTSEAAAVVSGYLAGNKSLGSQDDIEGNYKENPKNEGKDEPETDKDKFTIQWASGYISVEVMTDGGSAQAFGTGATAVVRKGDGSRSINMTDYDYKYVALSVTAYPDSGWAVDKFEVGGDVSEYYLNHGFPDSTVEAGSGTWTRGDHWDPVNRITPYDHIFITPGHLEPGMTWDTPYYGEAWRRSGTATVKVYFKRVSHLLNVNLNDPDGNEQPGNNPYVGTFSVTNGQNWDWLNNQGDVYEYLTGTAWVGQVHLNEGYALADDSLTYTNPGYATGCVRFDMSSDHTVNINTRRTNVTFNFDANGGTGGPDPVKLTYGSGNWNTLNRSDLIPKAGIAQFQGWYTSPDERKGEQVYDANGNAVNCSFWNNGVAKFPNSEDGKTYTLYAHWKAWDDSNLAIKQSDGSEIYGYNAMTNEAMFQGQPMIYPSGYSGTTPLNYALQQDLTFDDAHGTTADFVKFTLGYNGKKVADNVYDSADYIIPGDTIQISNVSVPAGYKFLGYDVYQPQTDNITYQQRVDANGNGKDLNLTVPLAGRDCFIVMQGVAYNVHFDSNPRTYDNKAWPDGSPLNLPTGSMSDKTFHYGEKEQLPDNTYAWPGHTFLGWSLKADATTPDTIPVYTAQGVKTNVTLSPDGLKNYGSAFWNYFGQSLGAYAHKDGASITLYAVWRTEDTTIKIDPNGGTYSGSKSVTQKWGSSTTVPNPTPATENITVTYDFNDTADEHDTKVVKKDANGNNMLDKDGNPVYETVKAVHSPGSWDATQPKGVSSSATSQNKDSSTMVFNRWDIVGADKNVYGNSVTYGQGDKAYGYFSDGTHYVFAENPVTLQAQYWHTEITLPRPVRDGYTFIGWYSDEKCTQKVGNAGDAYRIPNGSSIRTFYARWIKNTYTYQDTIDLRMEDTTSTREGWLYIGKFDDQGNPITTVDTAPENSAYNQAIIQISEGDSFDASKVVLTLKTGSGLYDANGKLVGTMFTDRGRSGYYDLTGHVTFGKTYTVHESQAPAGYYYSQDIKFTATENSFIQIDVTDSPINFDVVKQDSKVHTPLSNATFQLIDHSQNDKVVCTDTTDENGRLNNIGKNLIAGHNMTLHETNAPTGYKVKDYPIQVPQYKDSTWETNHLTAEQYILPETSNYVKLNIKKVDKSGTGLSGAQFQLYVMKNGHLYEARHDNDNNLLDPMSSDYAKYAGNTYLSTVSGDDGLAKFEQKLPPKALSDGTAPQEYTLDWGEKGTEQDWYIKEIKAPEGRSLLSHPVKVSLKDEDNKTYTVVIQDDQVIEVLNSGGSGSYKVLYLGLSIAVVGALGAYFEKRRTA